MTTLQKIKKITKEINSLCEKNEFKKAGELAEKHKDFFKRSIENGGISLPVAYTLCDLFNMRQTDCFNLVIK